MYRFEYPINSNPSDRDIIRLLMLIFFLPRWWIFPSYSCSPLVSLIIYCFVYTINDRSRSRSFPLDFFIPLRESFSVLCRTGDSHRSFPAYSVLFTRKGLGGYCYIENFTAYIYKSIGCKPYIRTLIHELNEDDFGRRVECCEMFLLLLLKNQSDRVHRGPCGRMR